MDEPQFEFQKLEVYQRAMELKFLVERIIQQLPTGTADLRNQLRRSDRSVRLNTAEGAGKHRPGGEVERFRTAAALPTNAPPPWTKFATWAWPTAS